MPYIRPVSLDPQMIVLRLRDVVRLSQDLAGNLWIGICMMFQSVKPPLHLGKVQPNVRGPKAMNHTTEKVRRAI